MKTKKDVFNKKNKVPFFQPLITNEDKKEVMKALNSSLLTDGPKLIEFEKEFAKSTNSKYAIGVTNATSALQLSLICSGIKKGDEVIIPNLTFVATASSVILAGATPVLADVDDDTLNISIDSIQKNITKKTKAIIPVHLAGMPCNMKKIIEIGKKNNLKIIEDCAHAIGAKIGGKHVGTFGNAGCFSFYPTKNITTIEGGMIITNCKQLADKIRLKRNHGITRTLENRYTKGRPWEYDVEEPGYNFRLDEIRSALGKNQIKKIKEFNRKREKSFDYYNSKLSKIPGIIVPKKSKNYTSSYHLYIIRILDSFGMNRDELFEKLLAKGIQTSVHYKPLNKFQVCKNKAKKFDSLNKSEKIYEEIISLPFFTNISKNQLDIVIKSIKKIQESTN
jgi:dTDP-4-amino-4,6-dideoxygalactose transaminase